MHGYYSEKESIYLYQLRYEGEYADNIQQNTLYLEDACIERKIKQLVGMACEITKRGILCGMI